MFWPQFPISTAHASPIFHSSTNSSSSIPFSNKINSMDHITKIGRAKGVVYRRPFFGGSSGGGGADYQEYGCDSVADFDGGGDW